MRWLVFTLICLSACGGQRRRYVVDVPGTSQQLKLDVAFGTQKQFTDRVCMVHGLSVWARTFAAAGYVVQVARNVPANDFIGPYAIRFRKNDVSGDFFGKLYTDNDQGRCYEFVVRVQRGVTRQKWQWLFGAPYINVCDQTDAAYRTMAHGFGNAALPIAPVPAFSADSRFVDLPSDFTCQN